MSSIDFSKVLFRCHNLGEIMTNITSKTLTKGHITYCRKLHRQLTTGREPEYTSKYLEKGIKQEQDGITLLSRFLKKRLEKNTIRFENEYLTGEPDIIDGFDIKCSWDLWTFPYPGDKLDAKHEFQNLGYMALRPEKKEWTTAFTLVNALGEAITREKTLMFYKMNMPADNNPEYVAKCIKIEKNMIFDMELFLKDNPGFDFHSLNWDSDIPLENRVMLFPVQRDDELIAKAYERITMCRSEMSRYQSLTTV